MSLPKDIDVDAKFKRLEYLAFRGRWDPDEQDRLARILGLADSSGDEETLCGYDRRLSSLETIYTFLTEFRDYENVQQRNMQMISDYLKQHPAARKNIPSGLHRTLSSKKYAGHKEGWEGVR